MSECVIFSIWLCKVVCFFFWSVICWVYIFFLLIINWFCWFTQRKVTWVCLATCSQQQQKRCFCIVLLMFMQLLSFMRLKINIFDNLFVYIFNIIQIYLNLKIYHYLNRREIFLLFQLQWIGFIYVDELPFFLFKTVGLSKHFSNL